MDEDPDTPLQHGCNYDKGTFVISLDTELSWGCFDTVGANRYKKAYQNTRDAIVGLCNLFDKYDIPVTWALVMHLLDECNGHEDMVSPRFEWIEDWFGATPCSSGVDKDLWYAPDILDELLSRDVEHEIALHGYSHMILGAPGCTRGAARTEIQKAIEIAQSSGIEPNTFVFPRNSIGHLELLAEAGIQNFRGKDDYWYENYAPRALRRPLRFRDEFLRRTPPVVTPEMRTGLLEVPGSQILRPLNHKWRYTPSNSQVKRAIKGLEKAATTGEIFHIWFHPFNIATDLERHLQMFEQILRYAARLRAENRIKVRTIDGLSEK
jgi:peptidoglycan/xylan/chitin deacetylase (PgdA/CDA1 family)